MASQEYKELLAFVLEMEHKYKTLTAVRGRDLQKMHRLAKPCYGDIDIELTPYEYEMVRRTLNHEITPGQLRTIFSKDGGVKMTYVTRRLKAVKSGAYEIIDKPERWEHKRK